MTVPPTKSLAGILREWACLILHMEGIAAEAVQHLWRRFLGLCQCGALSGKPGTSSVAPSEMPNRSLPPCHNPPVPLQGQQGGVSGPTMEALAGTLQEGVLPLVPSLLHDDGPMALHAIKLLGALLGADLPRWMPQFQRWEPDGVSCVSPIGHMQESEVVEMGSGLPLLVTGRTSGSEC